MHKYIRLRSGTKYYLLRPTVAQVNLEDIVWSLSHLPRFLAHMDRPYSILQHLCWCHDHAADDVKKEALCHDFSEHALSDLVSMLKALIPQYQDIERKHEKVIARRFGIRYPFPAAVKSVDLYALATEMRWLTNRQDYKDLPFEPSTKPIVPWGPAKTRREFMKRWNMYTWPE